MKTGMFSTPLINGLLGITTCNNAVTAFTAVVIRGGSTLSVEWLNLW